ncbi:MAG: hypothetical protein V4683_19020 [Bacteroidota bacterium]
MNQKYYFILLTLIFISCKKNEPVDNSSPLEKLTSGTSKSWKYLESKTEGKSDLGPCNNDDRLIFNVLTSKLLIDRGTVKCFVSEENKEFTFGISADGKVLSIDQESYDVLSFTKKMMKLVSRNAQHEGGEVHNHLIEITLEAVN